MTDIPFTTFNGYLKYIRPNALTSEQRVAQSLAFQGFFIEPIQNPQDVEFYERDRLELDTQGISHWLQQPFTYRRYAGGTELPRGRYYSVCSDQTGNDHQTLASELTAYIDPNESGEVYTVDLSDPAYIAQRKYYANLWPEAGAFDNVIAALFRSRPGCPSPFMERYSAAIGEPIGPMTEMIPEWPVFFPTRTVSKSISRCIDLRRPEVQKWFNSQLRAGIPGVTYLYRDIGLRKELLLTEHERSRAALEHTEVNLQDLDIKVDTALRYISNPDGYEMLPQAGGTFVDLLPLLMFPIRGGSPVTEAIAVWLRRIGANAFIFPSARTDPYCKIENGELVETRGWNLVDYRNAPNPPSLVRLIEEPVTWTAFRYGMKVVRGIPGGPYEGSWHTFGNRGAEIARVRYESELYYQQKCPTKSKLQSDKDFFILREQSWTGPISLAELKASLFAGLMSLSMPIKCSSEGTVQERIPAVGEIVAEATPVENEPYWENRVVWTGSWFVHQWGIWDAEVLVRCPICNYKSLWPYFRGYFESACPTCGFSNGEPEDREAIRSRILKQAEYREKT